ncbi:MAG: hypothetical protein GTN74_17900 [Proteobacteria bacterium]|nr:hypothetical protein [Pseudomonadota bacterium]NIS72781.1 hypothetical protein [Pseudomonadota bacterium]
MKPIGVEVVSKVLTSYMDCGQCRLIFDRTGLQKKMRIQDMEEYPDDLKQELTKLSEWLKELVHLYRHRIHIRVINAQSIPGIYKAIRHGIGRYPCFIVGNRDTYVGWDKERLEAIIDAHIRA